MSHMQHADVVKPGHSGCSAPAGRQLKDLLRVAEPLRVIEAPGLVRGEERKVGVAACNHVPHGSAVHALQMGLQCMPCTRQHACRQLEVHEVFLGCCCVLTHTPWDPAIRWGWPQRTTP